MESLGPGRKQELADTIKYIFEERKYTRADLFRLVTYSLSLSPDNIVHPDASLETLIMEVIDYADRTSRVTDLIDALLKEVPEYRPLVESAINAETPTSKPELPDELGAHAFDETHVTPSALDVLRKRQEKALREIEELLIEQEEARKKKEREDRAETTKMLIMVAVFILVIAIIVSPSHQNSPGFPWLESQVTPESTSNGVSMAGAPITSVTSTSTSTPTPAPPTPSDTPRPPLSVDTPSAVGYIVPPTPATADAIEIEHPDKIAVGESALVRLTLRRVNPTTYIPTVEIVGSDIVTAFVTPPGTPVALTATYGPNFRLQATAIVTSAGLDVQPASIESQPYDTDVLVWRYSIRGDKTGKQGVVASIYIQWVPDQPSPVTMTIGAADGSIKRQVWSGSFDVEVEQPVVRTGSYTVGELWQILFGTGFFSSALTAFGIWMVNKFRKDKTKPAIVRAES
jgi:hypothetical protein